MAEGSWWHRWDLLGVGFTAIAAMIEGAQYTTRGVILGVVCILIGMPAFMFHIMKE